MSSHVYVVSEWLPKKGDEAQLWQKFKELMQTTKNSEKGCVSARVTKQISHPGSPGKSKYKFVLMQEYKSIQDFDLHCESAYVNEFVKTYIENESTAIIADGRCRLFSEEG